VKVDSETLRRWFAAHDLDIDRVMSCDIRMEPGDICECRATCFVPDENGKPTLDNEGCPKVVVLTRIPESWPCEHKEDAK